MYKLQIITGRTQKFSELVTLLRKNEFQVEIINNYSESIDHLVSFEPEVILIDSELNDLAARELCISIRGLGFLKSPFVFILSDQLNEINEIAAFNAGADDYIYGESRALPLVKQIQATLRKNLKADSIETDEQIISSLKIDRDSYSVLIGEKCIQLSRKEFELLYLMASKPDKMFDRDELFRQVWNKEIVESNSRTLDVHMSRLRQKIGSRYITTQKGVGYKFVSN